MAVPIWKDYFVTLSTSSSIYYRIQLVGDSTTTIYQGKAFKRPGQSDITVRINEVCADYLTHILPNLIHRNFSFLDQPVTFKVQTSSSGSGSWTDKDTVAFLNDWSYDYDYDAATMGMSFPINGRMDARMPFIWTGIDQDSIQVDLQMRDGTVIPVWIPAAISDDFNNDFNNDFAQSVRSPYSGTAVFYASSWGDVERVTINGTAFDVVTECGRYALYYVNAYGGWDAFLIEGNDLQADNLTRYTREVEYDNRNITNRGKMNYVNEMVKTYTFHTGWLTGDQASRMHHLLNSPDVYMYDIAREQMIPVILTNNTTEYKTFSNQGNRLVNYTIQAEVAQSMVRR